MGQVSLPSENPWGKLAPCPTYQPRGHSQSHTVSCSPHCGWMSDLPQPCSQKLLLNLRLTCQGHLFREPPGPHDACLLQGQTWG